MNKIYVYGTLRPGKTEPVKIPGQMFDLGWFPGVKLSDSGDGEGEILAEVIEVDEERLRRLDEYEGYNPNNPETSLYIRKEFRDGFIYEYNRSVEGRIPVLSGDWLDYTKSQKGSNACLAISE